MFPDAPPPPDLTRRFVAVHLTALVAPVAAGVAAFGWRAAAAVALVWAGAAGGWAVWRRIGRRGRHLGLLHTLWLATLVAALLPAHLMSDAVAGADGPVRYAWGGLWPVLPAAGLLVVMLNWTLGGTAGGRINPALATYLLLLVLLGGALVPHLALRRENAVTGDLMQYRRDPAAELAMRPWNKRPPNFTTSAVWQVTAAERLSFYTLGLDPPERRRVSLQTLIRDRMPPMEDLIVLGQPAPIGLASAAAVVAGGLLLIFRGVADGRIGLLVILGAYLTFLLAPVPLAITRDGPTWAWAVPLRADGAGGVGWDVGLTYVHYELLCGPILFIALFLAPLPSLRPLPGRWRVAYSLVLGPALAVAQLYGGVAYGPFVALLVVGLCTPFIDRFTRARTLV